MPVFFGVGEGAFQRSTKSLNGVGANSAVTGFANRRSSVAGALFHAASKVKLLKVL